MRLFTREQIRVIDRSYLSKGGHLDHLVDEVGEALARHLHALLPGKQRFLFLLGPGHNGDDGVAMAKHLSKRGHQVELLCLSTRKPDENDPWWEQVRSLQWPQKTPEVIVDALFGIGLDRQISAETQALLKLANQASALRVALDLPTGIDANTGKTWALEPFQAHLTLSVAEYKVGCFLPPGRSFCGDLRRVPITTLQNEAEGVTLPPPDFFELLPPSRNLAHHPSAQDNKYTRGVVNVVQSRSFPGAALLAAQAALNTGVGYVRLWCPRELQLTQAANYPQIVMEGYTELSDLREALGVAKHPSAWLLGSGWSDLPKSLEELLSLPKALVLDGGCLQAPLLSCLQNRQGLQTVLTPHQGELARLIGNPQISVLEQCQSVCAQAPLTLVRKGYETLVAQAQQPTAITSWNSPNLAFAGSGDILAGLITGCLAQGLPAYEAALWGVHLHREVASRHHGALTPEALLQALRTHRLAFL